MIFPVTKYLFKKPGLNITTYYQEQSANLKSFKKIILALPLYFTLSLIASAMFFYYICIVHLCKPQLSAYLSSGYLYLFIVFCLEINSFMDLYYSPNNHNNASCNLITMFNLIVVVAKQNWSVAEIRAA